MGSFTFETSAETRPAAASLPSWLASARSGDAGPLLLLAAIWVLLSAAVNPLGDFPLNDDWSFGRSVANLVEDGTFELTGWMSMTFVVQLFWGALFCLPAGFSFTALRLSTLTAGLIGLLAAYLLLREAGTRRGPALLGSLVVAVNPIYLHLSHTFMTDVPFVALALLSILFFVRAIQQESRRDLLFGTLTACGATLIRQVGIAIPVGYGLSLLLLERRSLANTLQAIGPACVVGGVLVTYNAGLARWHGLPALYHLPFENLQRMVAEHGLLTLGVVMTNAWVALFYVGLFTLPFSLAFAQAARQSLHSEPRAPASGRAIVVAGAVFVGFSLSCFIGFASLPFVGNILHSGGLGPLTLRDTYLLGVSRWPEVPLLRAGVTLAGAFGAAALLWMTWPGLSRLAARGFSRPLASDRVAVFAVAVGVVYLAPHCVGGFYDRYLLFLLPLALLTVSSLRGGAVAPGPLSSRVPRIALVAVALGIYAGFSIAATHDYLAWNRARWEAVRWLVEERRVSPKHIDGGPEVNGWYLYRPEYVATPEKSWWWVEDDQYVLAFGPIEGYEEKRAVPFIRWIPPGQGRVIVLRRPN